MQVYVERPIISLRGTTFQTRIHTTQCGSCDFVGNVKYDVFLHNVRIHRRCIICELDCYTKKGIMDHLASVHDEKVNCDMCDFQVSFRVLIFGGKIYYFCLFFRFIPLRDWNDTWFSSTRHAPNVAKSLRIPLTWRIILKRFTKRRNWLILWDTLFSVINVILWDPKELWNCMLKKLIMQSLRLIEMPVPQLLDRFPNVIAVLLCTSSKTSFTFTTFECTRDALVTKYERL